MTNDELNFIAGITEKDAVDIFRRAMNEPLAPNPAGLARIYTTYNYRVFKDTKALLRAYVLEGGKLSLDQLRFFYYMNKWKRDFPEYQGE